MGKVAIVTGAAGDGMGRSIALTFAREGVSVVINYLKNEEKAQKVVEYIRNNGGQAIAVQANVFLLEDCKRLVQTTLDTYEKVDILVLGPGAGWNPEKIENLESEIGLQDISQEISPIYNLLPLVIKDMEKRRWGRIVGIATNMAIPSPAFSYNVAKAGRIELLKLASKEVWEKGITVNVIAPGPIENFTSLEEACTYCHDSSYLIGRSKITPQDIAEGASYLCSDAARYVTGCALPFNFE